MTTWDPLSVTVRGGGAVGLYWAASESGPRPTAVDGEELRGHGRTSAVGLGPIGTKVYLFSKFNFQCENNSRKT
jgi:hypothetical protein